MLRKTLIAATAAAVMSVGGIAAMPTAANAANAGTLAQSATQSAIQSGAVVEVHYKRGRHGHRPRWSGRKVKVCTPVFRKIVRYDRWHRPHWKTVKVGHKCHWVRKRHHRVRRWH